ncbi:MAG TPA: HEAT repeat domain-containing protein, partial [bacterium]
MDCRQFEELYWLKAYGESTPGGEEGLQKHLDGCPNCRSRLAELDRLRAVLSFRGVCEPKPEALREARYRLAARLRLAKGRSRAFSLGDWIQGWRWQWQVGLAMASLAIGLLVGRFALVQDGWVPFGATLQQASQSPSAWQDQASLERLFVGQNILRGKSKISDVKVKQKAENDSTIEVLFKAAKEYSVTGRPDDPMILELLGWAVKNEDNSGVRLQSVVELARASDLSPKARQTLAYALVNDKNSGVRLRALEALRKTLPDELSEQAILNALMKDPNPAVRIGAIDALLKTPPSENTERMLLFAAETDSNEYVRKQARNAIRQSSLDYRMLDDNSQSLG